MTIYTSEELKEHLGHKIVVGLYSEGYVDEEVTIECETCHAILHSAFKYCPECKKRMNMFGECPDKCGNGNENEF